MTQALQYTLEQAAKQMDLSEVAVKRLSQYFQIPQSYYQAPQGQPRIFLYGQAEVMLLQKIQESLLAGHSLNEIKQIIQPELTTMRQVSLHSQVLPHTPHPEDDLAEYEDDKQLKAHLADLTFKQYRQNVGVSKPPFESLVKKIQHHDPISIGRAFHSVTASKLSSSSTQTIPIGPSWMTSDLKQRAFSLQRELLSRM
jgi:DNA-binding transcriptional MerR regulator